MSESYDIFNKAYTQLDLIDNDRLRFYLCLFYMEKVVFYFNAISNLIDLLFTRRKQLVTVRKKHFPISMNRVRVKLYFISRLVYSKWSNRSASPT